MGTLGAGEMMAFGSRRRGGQSVAAGGIGGGLDDSSDAVLVYGLFLECARWDPDAGCLTDPLASERCAVLPTLQIKPTRKPRLDERHPHSYLCPMYATSDRATIIQGVDTSAVLAVELPSSQPESHWIKAGAALICEHE